MGDTNDVLNNIVTDSNNDGEPEDAKGNRGRASKVEVLARVQHELVYQKVHAVSVDRAICSGTIFRGINCGSS